jgi:hypothetical protein
VTWSASLSDRWSPFSSRTCSQPDSPTESLAGGAHRRRATRGRPRGVSIPAVGCTADLHRRHALPHRCALGERHRGGALGRDSLARPVEWTGGSTGRFDRLAARPQRRRGLIIGSAVLLLQRVLSPSTPILNGLQASEPPPAPQHLAACAAVDTGIPGPSIVPFAATAIAPSPEASAQQRPRHSQPSTAALAIRSPGGRQAAT